MKNYLFALLFMGLFIGAHAQKGKPFPKMPCKTLEGKEVVLPLKNTGKFTLVGLAYSVKSEEALLTWYEPIYYKFMAKSKEGAFLNLDPYDVYMYFVPMFTGVNAAAAGAATKKMKEGVNEEIQEHILVFKGHLEEYKEALNFSKKDEPYFFVIDADGTVVYMTSGVYTDEKMGQIEDIVDEF